MSENRVYLILEGVCPDCNSDAMQTISVGGLPEEVEAFAASVSVEPTIWSNESGHLDAVLGIEDKCMACGHIHYIEKNRWGDWN